MNRAHRLKTIAVSLGIGAAMCLLLCGLAGLFAAAFGLREATTAGAIEQVLREDAEAGSSSNDSRVVVAGMRQIDLAGCPEEFQEVYQQHIQAWQRSADTLDAAEAWIGRYAPGQMTTNDVLNLSGPPENLSAEARTEFVSVQAMQANAQRAIAGTFEQVENLAREYGARTDLP